MPQKKEKYSGRCQGNPPDECLICFQNKQQHGNLLSLLFHDDLLCQDCRNRLKTVKKVIEVDGIECEILYAYDKEFSGMLIQYKELCDEAIYPVFLSPFERHIERKYHDFTMAGVPSSPSHLSRRGFDHIRQMFSAIALPYVSLFEKDEMTEQKKASQEKRRSIEGHIHLKEGVPVPQTPLLIVDDVLTSGESLKTTCALMKNHPYPVKALLVSATAKWIE